MQANRRAVEADWFVPATPARTRSDAQPMSLGERIKRLLGIAKWSDLLAEGDEPYFGL